MYNILEDIEKLTNVPQKYLNKFVDASNSAICDHINTSIVNGEEYTDIDIGIGTLVILSDGNELKYKFVPSKQLENNIYTTVVKGKNPLNKKLETSLVDRITKLYKDLL